MPENLSTPASSVDIVIAGAGPNGLWLAIELALAGVRPIVLDPLPGPNPEPKANGMVGQVIRLLDMRGLYHELGGAPGPPRPIPAFLFSGIPLPLDALPENPMYALGLPQPELLRRLDIHVRKLGIDVRWEHELTDFTRTDDGVRVNVRGPAESYDIDTTYLVGADGGRSFVRKRLGIDFPGVTLPTVSRLAHIALPDGIRSDDGGIDIPGAGHLSFGHNRFDRGAVTFGELEPGRPLLSTMEFDTDPAPDDVPMTLDELRASLHRVLGVDVPFEAPHGPGPHALRRVGKQNTRQAERYRDGNVFLLGDAAHVHSAMGGPGLNLGLQDAANLGWKLAAQVNGWAPEGLLDTYQSERYPAGERVMMQSLSQSALMAPGPELGALRTLFTELLRDTSAVERIAGVMSGADVRYDIGNDHPLAGHLFPDRTLDTGVRVTELLRPARGVLLDPTPDHRYGATAAAWHDRVDTVHAAHADTTARTEAMLIRPDGYVAWAADTGQEDSRLRAALGRWFGAPRKA
ncbi:FAD-dependent monooxygenase [Nocardia callitridis]|uniref:FAD-dependent monooxygenase n=1 Tax=Nocardia callitridis TaxID=648753 RepID=A0ABP9KNA0_9NOCA